MRHWIGEADRAHRAGKRAAQLAAKQLSWSELNSAQVETAMRLGCGSAEAWDGGVAVIWLKSWDDLTPTEVAAATELGFDEWNWNEEDAVGSRQSAFCMIL